MQREQQHAPGELAALYYNSRAKAGTPPANREHFLPWGDPARLQSEMAAVASKQRAGEAQAKAKLREVMAKL